MEAAQIRRSSVHKSTVVGGPEAQDRCRFYCLIRTGPGSYRDACRSVESRAAALFTVHCCACSAAVAPPLAMPLQPSHGVCRLPQLDATPRPGSRFIGAAVPRVPDQQRRGAGGA